MRCCPECNKYGTLKFDKVWNEYYCKACGWSEYDA